MHPIFLLPDFVLFPVVSAAKPKQQILIPETTQVLLQTSYQPILLSCKLQRDFVNQFLTPSVTKELDLCMPWDGKF